MTRPDPIAVATLLILAALTTWGIWECARSRHAPQAMLRQPEVMWADETTETLTLIDLEPVLLPEPTVTPAADGDRLIPVGE